MQIGSIHIFNPTGLLGGWVRSTICARASLRFLLVTVLMPFIEIENSTSDALPSFPGKSRNGVPQVYESAAYFGAFLMLNVFNS